MGVSNRSPAARLETRAKEDGLYNSNPTYTFRDNVSKIVGLHNLQFEVC
jgi:hypothetical protein